MSKSRYTTSSNWTHGDVLHLKGFPSVKVMFLGWGMNKGTFFGFVLVERKHVFRKGKIEGFDESYYTLDDPA